MIRPSYNPACRSYIDSNKVAIVCSARSGSTKALGTTNLLLRAASEALRRRPKTPSGYVTPVTNGGNGFFGRMDEGSLSPPPTSPRLSEAYPWGTGSMTPLTSDTLPEFHATVDLIREEHFNAARASVQDPDILQKLEAEIERDCEWLRSFLYASQVSGVGRLHSDFELTHWYRLLTRYRHGRRIPSSASGSGSRVRS